MEQLKPRAIFTNDAECDDMNSLLHLLLYANEIDIEGLVLSSSIFHYEGDPEAGVEPYRWAGASWMFEYIDAYEQVLGNLRVHDAAYPSADALRAVTCVGNVKTVGDMAEDTPGSRLICERIFADDPRPLWLLAGGGTNTIGRALKSIEAEFRDTPEWGRVYAQVCEKARIFMIITQDDTYRDYIAGTWPNLPMLHCTSLEGIGFFFDETNCTPEHLAMVQGAWMRENLLEKGPLLAHYHTWGDGHRYPGELEESQFGANPAMMDGEWWGKAKHVPYDMISEGDSPSFLHLVDRGLRQLEDPSFGGWGGRFSRVQDNEFNPKAAYWATAPDAAEPPMKPEAYQFTRWSADWMSEFAARASWCVESRYEDANHAPELRIAEGLDLVAAPGETLVLHAEASDPDGDALAYSWFRYADADTAKGEVKLLSDGAACQLTVPEDAVSGDTVHIVCRVTDQPADEQNYLTAYARIIITVR